MLEKQISPANVICITQNNYVNLACLNRETSLISYIGKNGSRPYLDTG